MKDNKKILIIDNDEDIQRTYQKIFTPGAIVEYQLSQAENGAQGIELIKNAISNDLPFAVAFIAMKMPGLNGAETIKKIWSIDPDIKIVIVTAFSEYSPAEIIEFIGRDDLFYLRKPFHHEEILQFARALTKEWNLEKNRDFLELSLTAANAKLEKMNIDLKQKVKKQAALIVQTEKMASVGILAAGIAHEINNPISFINSNLSVVKNYFKDITDLFQQYSDLENFLENKDMGNATKLFNSIKAFKKENDIDVIIEDLNELADESLDGVQRVRNIINDLKNFSRIEGTEFKYLNINDSIDTTLNIIWNELKYKVTIEKNYGSFPEIKCFPQKISQVFMNLLINAGQAIEQKGIIKISTKIKKLG
ncbi:MAG: response regulator, partial [Desulfobacteraceae bacterium]|nr:response regulator [Desulfobacteraceae bacterium]